MLFSQLKDIPSLISSNSVEDVEVNVLESLFGIAFKNKYYFMTLNIYIEHVPYSDG